MDPRSRKFVPAPAPAPGASPPLAQCSACGTWEIDKRKNQSSGSLFCGGPRGCAKQGLKQGLKGSKVLAKHRKMHLAQRYAASAAGALAVHEAVMAGEYQGGIVCRENGTADRALSLHAASMHAMQAGFQQQQQQLARLGDQHQQMVNAVGALAGAVQQQQQVQQQQFETVMQRFDQQQQVQQKQFETVMQRFDQQQQQQEAAHRETDKKTEALLAQVTELLKPKD